ncbi:LysR family transcriptional regulator [Pectobacterium punjabense]|uniref:LysR family transcriptional regulator n=1 Tax=Pectobacterium punjabense TaxID=2108399 RepID=A0ABX6L414_9GAMM|nr:LysR family transcriptional regulator [Pectobacterium punjabense]MBS4429290.1 LysR family transcriptional regulator [Pectobacterium punjabense]PTA65140.1 LysR family transcriptional regulator [Pectobacterium punjabense]QJA20986.1 LysR family transcriptional regulator [Pectobacterium punjabense]
MIDGLDIKHMRMFMLLTQEKNVSKVALKTDMSQQAVSAYLKRLRSFFPVEIFLRKNAGLQPTDYAIDLADKIGDILHAFDSISGEVEFLPQNYNKAINIMANEYAQLTILPAWFQSLRMEVPNLHFEVSDFNSKNHANALAGGDVDMVIGFSDHIDDGLIQKKLLTEHYSCVVRQSSLLNKPNDISSLPAVRFSTGPGNIEDIVDKCFEEAGIGNNILATLPCYTTLPAFMAINDVVAFIPSAIAKNPIFRIIPHGNNPEKFDISCSWHRKSQGNPLRKWLTQKLEVHLKKISSQQEGISIKYLSADS